MKVYVQNGETKKIVSAKNQFEAAKKLLSILIAPDSEGTERCPLSPTTIVSDFGFLTDIMNLENRKQSAAQLKKVGVYLTSSLFERMGRQDIADFVKPCEKKLPKDLQKKLGISV